jgi:hypothetical protein
MKFKISYTVDDDENSGQKILLLSVEVIPSPRLPRREGAAYTWVIPIDQRFDAVSSSISS